MCWVPPLNNIRFFTLHCRVLKSYYDILGVQSNATQADIKTAYYKLSMLYHPDKNQGSKDAAEKFQSISKAYEVLGNYQRRRLYDKGLLIDSTNQKPKSPNIEHSFKKQRPMGTGRTPVYDFDEWSRAHYGKSFARRAAAKQEFQQRADNNSLRKRDNAMFFLVFLLLSIVAVSSTMQNSLDEPKKSNLTGSKDQDSKKKN